MSDSPHACVARLAGRLKGGKTTVGVRIPREISLNSNNELPSSFRGYDRTATDALLARVEESYRELLAERDQLLERLGRAESRAEAVERDLGDFREQADALGRALVRAEELRLEAERDAEVIRSEAERVASEVQEQAERAAAVAVREAETTRTLFEREAAEARERAHREADDILNQASRRADDLVVDAEELMNRAKEHLTGLVRDLFERAGATRPREDGSKEFREAFDEEPSRSDPAPN
ncbi:MAG TPA: DivIVA domain-containing protein [Gaiellaceae bacterium]|nr:DivIVA domain-containing protein [Gaiellaceae bacterium]